MKKILLTSLLMTFSILSFAKVDRKKLLGDWVKIKTETLDGKEAKGKFGYSYQYLRFSFTKDKMSFAKTPYDDVLGMEYDIFRDTIQLSTHFAYYKLPETYYFIEKVDNNELILKANFENKDFRYFLKKQTGYQSKQTDSIYQFDNDTILIRSEPLLLGNSTHIHISKTFSANALSQERYFYPRPLFEKDGECEFGNYLCWNLKYDGSLTKDEFSKPIKVSFLIDYKGRVSNIELLEGLQDYYNNQIITLISKTNKKWIPTIINKPHTYAKMIFTIILLDKS